jgi:hypothetical protein
MVPPAIGAWSPIFLLSLLAGFLGFRLWRRL